MRSQTGRDIWSVKILGVRGEATDKHCSKCNQRVCEEAQMNPLDETKAELNGFYDAIYDNYGPGVPLSMEDSFRCIELHHKLEIKARKHPC